MKSPSEVAIRVTNLSKEFKLYTKPSDMFWEVVTGKPRHKTFRALHNISFDVKRGQVVGLVGRNGAGKSTLLKIITGTLDKTYGEVEVKGRVSSILELGTGFNSEYTGRENIFLGGLIVGLTREEIAEKIDWIIDFSELAEFIDQPFKTYSTGMQARLTFATAVCILPDILIVDEALAVGDAKFQRKCFAKIGEFRQAGHTILLVSHDLNSINNFCDHAILLERGEILEQGAPRHISTVYYNMIFGEQSPSETPPPDQPPTPTPTLEEESPAIVQAPTPTESSVTEAPTEVGQNNGQSSYDNEELLVEIAPVAPLEIKTETTITIAARPKGSKKVEIVDYGIRDHQGKRVAILESGRKYTLFLTALFYEDVALPGYGFMIRNNKGVEMYGIDTIHSQLALPPCRKGEVLEGRLEVTMWLTNGDYFLTAGIAAMLETSEGLAKTNLDSHWDEVMFTIPRLPHLNDASLVNLQHKFSFAVAEAGVPV